MGNRGSDRTTRASGDDTLARQPTGCPGAARPGGVPNPHPSPLTPTARTDLRATHGAR